MLLWSNMSVLVARDLVDYSRTAEKLLGKHVRLGDLKGEEGKKGRRGGGSEISHRLPR